MISKNAVDEPWKNRFRGLRVLQVLRVTGVTPLMRRITLGGPEAAGIPTGLGPNVKLVIPPVGVATPGWPQAGADGKAVWPDGPMPIRTYTARRHDAATGEIDVDFVLHDTHGPASAWAAAAKPGDTLAVGGPSGLSVRPADFTLLAGDQAALPAIGRILREMPRHRRGVAVIEVPNAKEEQGLDAPPGVAIRWLHLDGRPAGTATLLIDAVKALPWPAEANVFAWIGCESTSARAVRAYVRDERRLPRTQFLAIGYWRRGMSESEFKAKYDHDRAEDYYASYREHEVARGTNAR